MNDQPYVKEGFYLHFEKGLYKIVDFAYNKNKNEPATPIVIYQPQYDSLKLKKDTLFSLEIDKFLENVLVEDKLIPRFRHLGNSEEKVSRLIKENNIKIKPRPTYTKSSMLDREIKELFFGNYIIKGFAKHAEKDETQIIFTWTGFSLLYLISMKNLLAQTGIDPYNNIISKHISKSI